jgi:hypothetical protein
MKIAIMQPYLFPYIGYFQLINCADVFVIHDNVQYIKGGWINRNRVLINDKAAMTTFPIKKDSTFQHINKRYFVPELNHQVKSKFLKKINFSYHRAPHYLECLALIDEILSNENLNVADFVEFSLRKICTYLEIDTPILLESEMELPGGLKAEEKIIHVCKNLKGDCYVNAIGGMSLYSASHFTESGITLKFIKTNESLKYKQFNEPFIPGLSILDVMMFNSKAEIKNLLEEYDLIDGLN